MAVTTAYRQKALKVNLLIVVCRNDFSVSRGGLNDVKRQVQRLVHKKRLKDVEKNTTISEYWGARVQPLSTQFKSHFSRISDGSIHTSYNLPFRATNHLTDLFPQMFLAQ